MTLLPAADTVLIVVAQEETRTGKDVTDRLTVVLEDVIVFFKTNERDVVDTALDTDAHLALFVDEQIGWVCLQCNHTLRL